MVMAIPAIYAPLSTLPMAMAEARPGNGTFEQPPARVYRMLDEPADAARDVDWVTGACMLIRYEVVGQVGMLDERFFMYSEELDWCRRIAAAGWRIVYLPSAVVVHLEGQSSGQVVAARHIRFNTSKVLYFFKHHGRLQAECLRLSILLMYGCEWSKREICPTITKCALAGSMHIGRCCVQVCI